MAITTSKWMKAEELFSSNNYDGAGDMPVEVEGCAGAKILLVATHGTNHFSGVLESDKKPADLFTGGLTRVLARESRVRCVFNRFRSMAINPHIGYCEIDHRITELVRTEGVRIILDIHGARDNPVFDVAIGTGALPLTAAQRRLTSTIALRLCDAGWGVAINAPAYRAAKPVSIVSRHKTSVRGAAVQLEIARRLRTPQSKLALDFANDLATVLKEFAAK